MHVPNWSAAGRSALRFLVDRLLRALLAMGSIATGVAPTGWWQARGEHWWEGATPLEDSGPRSVIAAARTEPGALDDPGVLREMQSLRGSQDLPLLCEGETCPDAAPLWHPERRPAGGEN
jgi:hypothetical protein